MSDRLAQLQAELEEVNRQLAVIHERHSRSVRLILAAEANKLLRRKRNIQININQERQKRRGKKT